MTQTSALRLAVVLAGLMGAAGVALAATAAHQPDATRLGSASSMLLFHASAVAGAALLTGYGIARRAPGLTATFGFVAGAALFAGDLVLRQYAGHGLFPMAAPTGGTLLILSWLVLALAAVWPRPAT
ncbi:DUF423 domain-containing protein [Bradyrhizobium sp. G127]|jgi:uncharacterized membrane protein YgdD (TMEM256/DUF423 family)|uniref:DUF423 domain-containing protein n=1 Tax=Bradyrhizobium sp. G127 TaxID=2904800 RepID=UPI001F2A45A6|nr:DUF423 domain-containing protein [Bradyrhizobium sp. G127]MCF2521809.1 DUF423 domain-containing protein [Bradyrhizobium sp. G127]